MGRSSSIQYLLWYSTISVIQQTNSYIWCVVEAAVLFELICKGQRGSSTKLIVEMWSWYLFSALRSKQICIEFYFWNKKVYDTIMLYAAYNYLYHIVTYTWVKHRHQKYLKNRTKNKYHVSFPNMGSVVYQLNILFKCVFLNCLGAKNSVSCFCFRLW